MEQLEICRFCPNFRGNIGISLEKSGEFLSIAMRCHNGCGCVIVTDVKGISDIVPRKEMAKWHSLPPRKQLESLEGHGVGIIDVDDDCPYKLEILMSDWNKD